MGQHGLASKFPCMNDLQTGMFAPGKRGGEIQNQALEVAGSRARGATLYVTLEPCSHHGKTPPCAPALVEAGVSEVVIAMQDPFPAVSGNGRAALEAAGIRVRSGLMQAAAAALNEGAE